MEEKGVVESDIELYISDLSPPVVPQRLSTPCAKWGAGAEVVVESSVPKNLFQRTGGTSKKRVSSCYCCVSQCVPVLRFVLGAFFRHFSREPETILSCQAGRPEALQPDMLN